MALLRQRACRSACSDRDEPRAVGHAQWPRSMGVAQGRAYAAAGASEQSHRRTAPAQLAAWQLISTTHTALRQPPSMWDGQTPTTRRRQGAEDLLQTSDALRSACGIDHNFTGRRGPARAVAQYGLTASAEREMQSCWIVSCEGGLLSVCRVPRYHRMVKLRIRPARSDASELPRRPRHPGRYPAAPTRNRRSATPAPSPVPAAPRPETA
jgi:hypothetical protein